MEMHVNQFASSPWDSDNLKQLGDHFHQIAGSAGVYNMPELTPIAEAGERLCLHMYENPPDDVIVYWRNFQKMVSNLKTVLEKAQHATGAGQSEGEMYAAAARQSYQYGQQSSAPDMESQESEGSDGAPPLSTSSAHLTVTAPDRPPPREAQDAARAQALAQAKSQAMAQAAQRAAAQASQSATTQIMTGSPQTAPAKVPAAAYPTNPQSGQDATTTLYSPSASPYGANTTGPDVIVVSTNPAGLKSMSACLQREGMQVRPCAGWNEAKDAVLSKFPDGIVVFVPLQDGDGYKLIEGCRSLEAGDTASIILVSEEHGFLDKIGAIKSGADAFFDLPVEVDVVVDKLRYLFERGKPERYRILSVEDDPDQAAYIISTLESAGYHVLWQQEPRAFEEALLTFCPDLLLLDIVMGDISGYDLAKFVRQNERFAATPILFLTTQNQLSAHIESAKAGGDDHLIKPVSPQLLVATIAGRLERYRIFKKLLKNDGLSQILNHSHFMDYAQRSVAIRSHRFSQVLTVFDIDDLKSVNNRYGFAVGDRTIVSLSQMIKKKYRHTDIIGRIGGDKIAVLDDSLSVQDSVNVARSLLDQFANVPHKAEGQVFKITASAGVSHLTKEGTLQELVVRVSDALRQAKQIGRNQIMRG